jgi:rod shape determining protein RodA
LDVLRRNIRQFDFTTVGVLILLGIYSCSALYAITHGKSSGGTLSKQIVFEIVGLIVMVAAASLDYRLLRKVRWWLYGLSILFLCAVFAFGTTNGAHSWIHLGPASFQPSELAKLTMIIVMADYMAKVEESEEPSYGIKHAGPLVLMMLVPFALTYEEPALGQALVMFAIFMTMYVVFTKRKYFLLLTLALFVIVFVIGVVAVQYPGQFTWFIETILVKKHHLLHSYQAGRIVTWLDPSYDISGSGFNVHESRMAIASGQVFGEGFLNGIITNGGFVPNQITDYIFTVIGEEFGFVGSSVLIFLFLVLVYRLVRIASTTQEPFGMYYIIGMVGLIGFQVFENIGADLYLSPSTGITLPFISAGGTSLLINYMAIGLALSVALRRKKLRFN